MRLDDIWARAQGRYRRSMSNLLFSHSVGMRNSAPLISFTFDDFPQSALQVGGAILKAHEIRGTYYTSLGLMGKEAPVGTIFSLEDLKQVLSDGHELGCHTFAHCHAWETPPSVFEKSVIDNQQSLRKLFPDASFPTLSYPISCPRPHTKRRLIKHFPCCRGGGQTYNAGRIAANHLSGYFLEQCRHDPESIKKMIDKNCQAGGWLIFATHDVCEKPTRFGCTPSFFEDIVQYAGNSGATILPVGEAWTIVAGTAEAGE